MANSSVVFKDLFDAMEERAKEREKWLKENPAPKLSVRQALSISAYLHDQGYEPNEIYKVLLPNKYDEIEVYAEDILEKAQDDYASAMIEIWRNKLFISKMFDSRKLSDWRSAVSHLLADPDKQFNFEHAAVVTSLPRYHEYEERYIRLGNTYKTFNKRSKKPMNATLELDYIEHWDERNSKKTRTTIYAFSSSDGYVVLLPLTVARDGTANTMLQELLRFTTKFKITGRVYTKILEPEKFALQFDHFREFEAVKA